jgi:hypothetical protein
LLRWWWCWWRPVSRSTTRAAVWWAAPTSSHWAETQRTLELRVSATVGGEPELGLALA